MKSFLKNNKGEILVAAEITQIKPITNNIPKTIDKTKTKRDKYTLYEWNNKYKVDKYINDKKKIRCGIFTTQNQAKKYITEKNGEMIKCNT